MAHAPLAVLSVAALIAFATMLRFAPAETDDGFDDWFGDFD